MGLLLALGAVNLLAFRKETREPFHPHVLAVIAADHGVPHEPRTVPLKLGLQEREASSDQTMTVR